MNKNYRCNCIAFAKKLRNLLDAHADYINIGYFPPEERHETMLRFKRRLKAFRKTYRELIANAHYTEL